MQVKFKTKVISEVSKVSKKTGNAYRVVNFMDDNQIVNVMVTDEVKTPVVPFEDYELTLDVNMRFGNFKIIDMARA